MASKRKRTKSNGMIKVLSGVPRPRSSQGRSERYPWVKMKAGQHFFFPKEMPIGTATSVAYYAGVRYDCKFSCRTMPDGRVGCWRMK